MIEEFRTLRGWAEGLRDAGADVTVVQGFTRDAAVVRGTIGYRFVSGRFAPQLRRWRIPRRLHRTIVRGTPDVVHVNGMLYAAQAYDLRRRLPDSVAVVVQHHAARPRRGPWSLVERLGLGTADGFIFAGVDTATPWRESGAIHAGQPVFEIMEGSSRFRMRERAEAHARTGAEGEAAHPEWRRRCFDLEVVRPLVGRAPRSILDVGSYNGWLAHGLAQDGHEVTAVDYFTDPYDGLSARRFYRRAPWHSIQMDLKDLSLLNETYDTVVLNRCLQFFPDPRAYFEHARELVAPGGLLIATGLDIYWDPRRKIRPIDQLRAEYRARYDRDLVLHETRGHLDRRDLHALSAAGLEVRSYRRLWRANLVARAFRDRPRFCFGVWRRAG